jgi:hypothetical protein
MRDRRKWTISSRKSIAVSCHVSPREVAFAFPSDAVNCQSYQIECNDTRSISTCGNAQRHHLRSCGRTYGSSHSEVSLDAKQVAGSLTVSVDARRQGHRPHRCSNSVTSSGQMHLWQQQLNYGKADHVVVLTGNRRTRRSRSEPGFRCVPQGIWMT